MIATDPHMTVVIKLNTQRQETWRYVGRILSQNVNSVLIEALFNRPDLEFHGITLREKDRFLERYYTDRWYNIFEIHDRDDDQIKAWYCNVTTPAEISPGTISYIDLALDLFVYPDGHYLVLDQDEFTSLDINTQMQENARHALDTLIQMAKSQKIAEAIHNEAV